VLLTNFAKSMTK